MHTCGYLHGTMCVKPSTLHLQSPSICHLPHGTSCTASTLTQLSTASSFRPPLRHHQNLYQRFPALPKTSLFQLGWLLQTLPNSLDSLGLFGSCALYKQLRAHPLKNQQWGCWGKEFLDTHSWFLSTAYDTNALSRKCLHGHWKLQRILDRYKGMRTRC